MTDPQNERCELTPCCLISFLPVSLWFALLQRDLPLRSPLTARARPAAGSSHPQGLQALGGLLVGELHLLTLLQAAEALHHQLALSGSKTKQLSI